jgi:hypothetical protein
VGPGSGRPRHFATRGWKRQVLGLKSCEGRGGEKPNRAPRVCFRWTTENSSAILWARHKKCFSSRDSRVGDPWFLFFNSRFPRRRYGQGSLSGQRSPHITVGQGPSARASRYSGPRELKYHTLAFSLREVPRRDGQRRLTSSGHFRNSESRAIKRIWSALRTHEPRAREITRRLNCLRSTALVTS